MDWRRLDPIESNAAGAGLNMVFRRSVLDELGECPDPSWMPARRPSAAGTPTRSTGSSRAATASSTTPAPLRLPQAPAQLDELHRAIRGYGIGLSAVLAKLVLEERELTAPRVWNGLWWLYRDAVRRGLAAWRIRWRFGSAGTTSRAAFSVRERMVESEKARPRSGRRADHPADRPTRLHGGATAPAERGGCRGLRDRLRLERARGASPLPRGACASVAAGLASETIVTGTGAFRRATRPPHRPGARSCCSSTPSSYRSATSSPRISSATASTPTSGW